MPNLLPMKNTNRHKLVLSLAVAMLLPTSMGRGALAQQDNFEQIQQDNFEHIQQDNFEQRKQDNFQQGQQENGLAAWERRLPAGFDNNVIERKAARMAALPGSSQMQQDKRLLCQQPNQSIIQQQIQPINQPQMLLQSQGQNQAQARSQMQNLVENRNQNQIPLSTTSTFSPPALHGLDQNNSASLTEAPTSAPAQQPDHSSGRAASPVETFFQVAPPAPTDQKATAKPHSRVYKVLWHTMDDIGIPMFRNHDPDIDPSLTRPFVMPRAVDQGTPVVGTQVHGKPTIIDPQAAAQDPSQMAPDDATKASTNSGPTPNPQ